MCYLSETAARARLLLKRRPIIPKDADEEEQNTYLPFLPHPISE
jgi:hypothetical protein